MITKIVINEVLEKCLTLANIRERLKTLDRNERINLLTEQNKLTQLEWEDYTKIRMSRYFDRRDLEDEYDEEVEWYLEEYEEEESDEPFKLPKHFRKKYDKLFGEIEKDLDERLFKYERRIFEDYQISKGDNPVPVFDWDDYVSDINGIEKFDINDEGGTIDQWQMKFNASRDSIMEVENNEINMQSTNVKYTPKELEWLKQYFDDSKLSSFLTYTINGREPKQYNYLEETDGGELSEFSLTDQWKNDFNNIKHHLDNAIDKSRGLENATILYHSGRPDPQLLVGDHGVWEGYKSTSFQSQVMQKHSNINDDYWNIIILAPKGTKGVCANDERFRGYSFVDEHEYLLGRNTGYTVVDMNYNTHTQIVILD